jgi:hypothetical protein
MSLSHQNMKMLRQVYELFTLAYWVGLGWIGLDWIGCSNEHYDTLSKAFCSGLVFDI